MQYKVPQNPAQKLPAKETTFSTCRSALCGAGIDKLGCKEAGRAI